MEVKEVQASSGEPPEEPPAPPAPTQSPIAARRPRTRLVLILLAVVGVAFAAVVLTGNGSFKLSFGAETLDAAELEATVAQELNDQGAPVEQVTCPERELREGDVFQCTAKLDGQELRIEMTQRDAEGNVDYGVLEALLETERVETVGADLIGQQAGTSLELDCGTNVWLVKRPGDTFECSATTSDGERLPVVVTVKDADGNVEFQVQ